jgi:hypothetical protein
MLIFWIGRSKIYFCKLHFSIILSSTPTSPKWFLPFPWGITTTILYQFLVSPHKPLSSFLTTLRTSLESPSNVTSIRPKYVYRSPRFHQTPSCALWVACNQTSNKQQARGFRPYLLSGNTERCIFERSLERRLFGHTADSNLRFIHEFIVNNKDLTHGEGLWTELRVSERARVLGWS